MRKLNLEEGGRKIKTLNLRVKQVSLPWLSHAPTCYGALETI